jgi:hypothetical protein
MIKERNLQITKAIKRELSVLIVQNLPPFQSPGSWFIPKYKSSRATDATTLAMWTELYTISLVNELWVILHLEDQRASRLSMGLGMNSFPSTNHKVKKRSQSGHKIKGGCLF